MNSKFNYNQQALIVGTYVLEIDSVSPMEYLMSERKWLEVVVKTKNDIPINKSGKIIGKTIKSIGPHPILKKN